MVLSLFVAMNKGVGGGGRRLNPRFGTLVSINRRGVEGRPTPVHI